MILGGVEFGAGGVAAVVLGLATLVVVWRLYLGARPGDDERAAAPEDFRRASAFAHALMVGAAVLIGVGALLVLADPWGTADTTAIATVLGGPAVYLVGELVLTRADSGRIAASRIAALCCLAVLALIAFALPALVLAALALAVVLLLSLAASGWFRLPSMDVDE
ncbi:low temperature requirement protein A [Glycomyces tritici]|uniref:Low temperature requirement protein A n=1 Tax=Glycomyces tritici TaxID=2665176 RepID=A0ABT7YX99_9ACTN|nr:low temperature requirement protein A [Glycomyces tritici]MDN3241216.1 low temperature requirement protein A [Glycomyces tritici]MDN3243239.1 low temperature requirement protein A [Glycomyces tritici]